MGLKKGLKDAFFRAVRHVFSFPHSGVRSLREFFADVRAGVREKEALPERQRSIDELKVGAGGAAVVAGALELNPVAVAGGAIEAWEGVTDLEKAGHEWRAKHPGGSGKAADKKPVLS